jgi:hypothetical protein
MKKYGVVKILTLWRTCTLHFGHPKTNRLLHTQQQTTHNKKNIKHRLHVPPKPQASSGSNFTGECDRRTLRDQSQSLQHGDVLFIDDTIFSFIYLLLFYVPRLSALTG